VSFKASYDEIRVCAFDVPGTMKMTKKQKRIDRYYFDPKQAVHSDAGAGGTTLAMNALWEFKESCRCAVVKQVVGVVMGC
jgi:hypothetical protein